MHIWFTYQETEVDIGAKEWAEDDWDHDVRPVAGDIVYHEERKRCHGRQQELEGNACRGIPWWLTV